MTDHQNSPLPKRFRARRMEVDAVQVIVGRTTKRAILELCPDANVGVPAISGDLNNPNLESTDLRWVVITCSDGPVEARDTDWIVKMPGMCRLMTPEEFETCFEPIDGARRA